MMTEKRKTYTAEFKQEAVRLVTEQRYGVAETARNLVVHSINNCRVTQPKVRPGPCQESLALLALDPLFHRVLQGARGTPPVWPG